MKWPNKLQIITITYTIVLIYLSLRPIPPEIGGIFSYQDKFMHLGAYTLLSLLYLKTIPSKSWATSLAILLGILLEIAQSFTSYRSFELLDIVANSLGVAIGFMTKKFLT